MATSGTRAFSLDVATAIEEAYELAGLEARTSYDAVTARRSMNIMFADWSNRVDRNEFVNIPNKSTKARATEYWLERLKSPVIHLYPTPENSTDKLIYYVWRTIEDSSAQINDVDIPTRFMPCLVSGLAYYICLKKNIQKLPIMKEQYEQDLRNAMRYDEDRSPLRIVPKHEYI